MRLGQAQCRTYFAGARHAVLASVRPDGRPHAVPVVFAIDSDDPDLVVTAVDGKPKSTTDLRRLRNIRADPAVALLVEEYDEDWSRLWWVRVDAAAEIVPAGPRFERALDLLADRYPAYRGQRPGGPVVAMRVLRVTGWAAS